ncbi:piggyBac transposable element-derived protein 4-like [Phymastichus coffea]|uniref:piggyBac transposable element-derived protein 4-like n=1 Tax=Phymastichus coffea TaxID=108790 RepID=UPI00273B7CDC|nr:piggyBac transposable element-derived protein 4-like [Phymastichus coffea]
MGRRRRIVNEIPSHSESVDGLCDSNDKDEVLDRRVDHVAPSINNLLEDEAHEEEIDDETTTTDSNKSEIWRSTSIPKTDLPFKPAKGDPEYDKLYKLRSLLHNLSETFRECWKPSHHQAIDESMIKFKGRSSMKQYMPAKPTKRGYKVWTRADESGFVCQFQIYTGKTDSPEKQLGARVVRDLTRDLVGHNHQVYFDNFFTGVELLISLKQDNILACGTVRSNRANLPKSNKSDKKMVIGEYEYKTSTSGLTWIKWMDKKPVYFLSNFHDPTETITHMGYVDYADRAISTYQIDRKSKKWWFRIFWHFIDLCICNGFILYKEKQIKPLLSLKKFRMRLVEQLVVHKIPTPKGRKRTAPNTPSHAKIKVPDEKRLSNAAHMP